MPRLKKPGEVGDKRGAVALGARANMIIAKWVEANGGGKTKFVESLLEFFEAAPESVRLVMAGRAPKDMQPEFAKRLVDHFIAAAADEPKSHYKPAEPHPGGVKSAREAAERSTKKDKARNEQQAG